ncbi:MAG: hypothetical protein M1828_006562 [Chrysothrix sp. TS-e1954]|nr:MAG: hypothetical protein M1828_006562 [Chrysothrix sp. TS-e1954]
MAGVTFLAFGNGSPDVFSTFAAIKSNSGSLAVGELIGAAGFISAVVAGSMALVRPFKVAKRSFVRDVGFFIVAVGFSMSFLANGSLELWECAVMVGFYVFYVVLVVVWHWWLGRRRRRREQAAAIRGHFINPNDEDIEYEEYRDDDEDATPGRRQSLLQNVSAEDFRDLEAADMATSNAIDDDLEQEAERDKWLGELSSNMRVKKPTTRDRSRTVYNPIRPSLVGALEFRAVLSSLQKSRNIQSMPISLRRYSDDPYYTTSQQQEASPDNPEPIIRSTTDDWPISQPVEAPSSRNHLGAPNASGRARAASANAADFLRVDTNAHLAAPQPTILSESPVADSALESAPISRRLLDEQDHLRPPDASPLVSISPPSEPAKQDESEPPMQRSRQNTGDLLAPPGAELKLRGGTSRSTEDTAPSGPRLTLTPPTSNATSRRSSVSHSSQRADTRPRSRSATASRPPHLRGPSASMDSYLSLAEPPGEEKAPPRWWPQTKLPSPDHIVHTLFPTICNWRQKTLWEKFLGLASAPSFFVLTITLPVVEPETNEEESVGDQATTPQSNADRGHASAHKDSSLPANGSHSVSPANGQPHHSSANVAVQTERNYHHSHSSTQYKDDATAPLLTPLASASSSAEAENVPRHPHAAVSSPKDWNRWLVILQCFTAPLFIAFMIWANFSDQTPRSLLAPILYSLLGSFATLLLLLLTTSPSRPPRWHFLLCFAGFAVAITWISSIANEVVGVLKAIGVIFNISDAILGLTVFAVGNSLGDLVADITVARLGYPVMALSACFGGPMLNILLGIGLSGIYMIVHHADARRERHPGREMKVKPYKVEVSPTLMVSAIVLLVTLVGLLIVVPLNGWWMSRRIGWGLVGLWAVATIGNVVGEVTGVLG